jgi:hypothetical protein
MHGGHISSALSYYGARAHRYEWVLKLFFPLISNKILICYSYVGKWNIDLLHMCGVVLRVFYDCLVGLQQETVNDAPTRHQKKGRNKGAKQ